MYAGGFLIALATIRWFPPGFREAHCERSQAFVAPMMKGLGFFFFCFKRGGKIAAKLGLEVKLAVKAGLHQLTLG